MSHYEINSLLFRLKKDAAFRTRFLTDPSAALAGADLTDAERDAFIHWNPRTLNDLGGYLHLLMSIPLHIGGSDAAPPDPPHRGPARREN